MFKAGRGIIFNQSRVGSCLMLTLCLIKRTVAYFKEKPSKKQSHGTHSLSIPSEGLLYDNIVLGRKSVAKLKLENS